MRSRGVSRTENPATRAPGLHPWWIEIWGMAINVTEFVSDSFSQGTGDVQKRHGGAPRSPGLTRLELEVLDVNGAVVQLNDPVAPGSRARRVRLADVGVLAIAEGKTAGTRVNSFRNIHTEIVAGTT